MMRPYHPDALSHALAEPSRRMILETLRFAPKTVSELVQATHLKQPNVSNHLAKMREHGIVRAERSGRHVYYSIAMPVADLLLRLHEFTARALQQSVPPSPLSPAGKSGTHIVTAPTPLSEAGQAGRAASYEAADFAA